MKPLLLKTILALMIAPLLLITGQTAGVFAAVEGTIDPFSNKPCYRCHLSKVSGPGVHSALKGNRCTPCHKLSNGNHLTNHRFSEAKDRTARLCYGCHVDQSHQKSVHPPIIDNDCFGCHVPHASTNGNLLKVPLEQLCFECHDRALMNEEDAGKTTGFSSAGRNLHYSHDQKAIPCLACHKAHASSQDHLLGTLTYQATANGGNCRSSCHGAAGYVRK